MASVSTSNDDIGDKRHDYADFGIPEYWRFDPTGERRQDSPIAGDRMSERTYHPVEIYEVETDHLHGRSLVLNLDLCWDHGHLRWYDPAAMEHLLTFAKEREARLSEQEACVAEREARLAAETRATAAEARLQELEGDRREGENE